MRWRWLHLCGLASLLGGLLGCNSNRTGSLDAPAAADAGPRQRDGAMGEDRDAPSLPDGSPWRTSYVAPTEENVLDGLQPAHPRLVLTESDLLAVRARLSDPTVQGYFAALKTAGEAMLSEKEGAYLLEEDPPKLLYVSRQVLARLYTLSLLFRLTGEARYRDRAVAEMKAVAAFPDWHPAHFLDVAEMTHAMAIGYDWLYSTLSASERSTFAQAILDHGLIPGRAQFDDGAAWTVSPANKANWGLVCNGGLAIGALAVADVDSARARWLLWRTVTAMPTALASYAPDGAWAEGPMYWSYATTYAVSAFAALRSALGHDFGLSALPGFSAAGTFRTHAVGPSGLFFNFGDAVDTTSDEPSLFWLARRFGNPLFAWSARQAAGKNGSYGDLMWYDGRGSASDLQQLPADQWFKGADVVMLRSGWEQNALYLGLKAGSNQAGHAHLDLGSFVFDASGERWAVDLGPDQYSSAYFDSAHRWTEYYRVQTQGHNTLLIKNANPYRNQNRTAAAALVLARSLGDQAYFVTDLSEAYATTHLGATQVRRGVALLAGRDRALIQDEVSLATAEEVYWALHTDAEVTISGLQATLRKDGKSLLVQIVEPTGSHFSSESIPATLVKKALPPETIRLAVRLPATVKTARFVILLLPSGKPSAGFQVHPLADWQSSGPGE